VWDSLTLVSMYHIPLLPNPRISSIMLPTKI
jgi:hypothetical protein